MAKQHQVVANAEWIEARKKLLAKKKEFTRLRDELSRERRALPWEAVTKAYAFDGADGRQTLPELFAGRSQLVVYHFMFGLGRRLPHCSRWADNFNGIVVHLNQRDVTMVAVSRAPYEKLAAYEKRMGWTFKLVSSFGTDFNFDYHVSFTADEAANKSAFYNITRQDPGVTDREGVSVFCKDAQGKVFHTYSTYARGIDMLSVDYQYLDLVPKGRDEGDRGPFWVRRHDEYGR